MMMRLSLLLSAVAVVVAVVGLAVPACRAVPLGETTALDEYVWAPDDTYGWVDTGVTIEGKSPTTDATWTGYVLNMTSQTWLTSDDVDRSVWWHYLVVIVPSTLKDEYSSNGTLWITGGKSTDGFPSAKDEDILICSELAMGTGVIVSSLFQIPNQPIVFADDPDQKGRSEGALLAYTWDHFLNNYLDDGVTEWIARFPMVKASLRAMDAVTEYVAQTMERQIDYYLVSGASKRGWATWNSAAVDPDRIVAIAPVVLDALNFIELEHHQWRSYGGWSYANEDFVDMDIMSRLDVPQMLYLQYEVDPYFYRNRLTMPKMVINAGMDEFQQPDDTHYWWDEMPDDKWFLMAPNTDHSYLTGILEAVPAMGTWQAYLLNNWEIPHLEWDINNSTGDITVTPHGGQVYSAQMWAATSCNNIRRDFRLATLDDPCTCGPLLDGYCVNRAARWYKTTLEPNENGQYVAHQDAPDDGRWTAFFVDIQFAQHEDLQKMTGGYGWPYDAPGLLEFTSEVSVVPDTFPYPDCYLDRCDNTIV